MSPTGAPTPTQPAVPVRHRPSVDQMTPAQLASLRQAITATQAIGDDRGYQHWAGIHGLPLPMYCTHNSPLFLACLSPEPVAVAETVQEALSLVAPLAAERGVQLGVDLGALGDDGHVRADRQRLRQVLLNLLSNAIKYNRASGRVDVAFEAEGDRLRILIADTGIGIAPERLVSAFEPFERLGAEHSEIEGTGLGLALSKRLVEAMGGTISVESDPARGTTFALELHAVEHPHSAVTAEAEPLAAAIGGALGRERQILYIEDNVSNLTLVERILAEQSGLELVAAMQGQLGLDLARQHRPDLIVLDLHLPDMTGEEVLRRLKADPSTRGIPVVVLSADASNGQVDRLLRDGADDYLTKPLDVTRFLGVLADKLGDNSAQ